MFDHVIVNVSDLRRSTAFYRTALEPLGIGVVFEEGDWTAFGSPGSPTFWVAEREPVVAGTHVAFTVESRDIVDAFHRAAMSAGGTDHGAPGVREEYHPNYYGAYVLDPDGVNVEAVCHTAP